MYMYRPYVYFKVRFCNCRLNLFINYTSSSCYFQFHEIVFVVFSSKFFISEINVQLLVLVSESIKCGELFQICKTIHDTVSSTISEDPLSNCLNCPVKNFRVGFKQDAPEINVK